MKQIGKQGSYQGPRSRVRGAGCSVGGADIVRFWQCRGRRIQKSRKVCLKRLRGRLRLELGVVLRPLPTATGCLFLSGITTPGDSHCHTPGPRRLSPERLDGMMSRPENSVHTARTLGEDPAVDHRRILFSETEWSRACRNPVKPKRHQLHHNRSGPVPMFCPITAAWIVSGIRSPFSPQNFAYLYFGVHAACFVVATFRPERSDRITGSLRVRRLPGTAFQLAVGIAWSKRRLTYESSSRIQGS